MTSLLTWKNTKPVIKLSVRRLPFCYPNSQLGHLENDDADEDDNDDYDEDYNEEDDEDNGLHLQNRGRLGDGRSDESSGESPLVRSS